MKKIVYDKTVINDGNLVGWNNKIAFYLDKSSLPDGYGNVLDLNNLGVLYYIVTEENIVYIGITTDFGQRIQTHIKESRSCKDNKKKLYKDIDLYGCGIIGIINVYETYEELCEAESRLIKDFKNLYLTEEFGSNYEFLISEEKQREFLFKKFYNIKN